MKNKGIVIAIVLSAIATIGLAFNFEDVWTMGILRTQGPDDLYHGVINTNVWYDGKNQYIRSDITGLGDGGYQSTTFALAQKLYFLNLPNSGFCVFEHLHDPEELKLPAKWTRGKDVKRIRQQVSCQGSFANTGVRTCDVYTIVQNTPTHKALGWILFNKFENPYGDIMYYEESFKQTPMAFMYQDGEKNITADVFSVRNVGTIDEDVFKVNMKDECH
mmetsp:Transcript_14071/g.21298  ORF Transcript_14071/g.21298 Transcript_14071/m.21298 type:complete len:218 (-) Transcript_14071:79-732(-)